MPCVVVNSSRSMAVDMIAQTLREVFMKERFCNS